MDYEQIIDSMLDEMDDTLRPAFKIVDDLLDGCNGLGEQKRVLLIDDDEEDKKEIKESKYHDFFRDMLSQYDIKSPSELDEEKKKEFFNAIKSGWKSKK